MDVIKIFGATPLPSCINSIDFMDHSEIEFGWDWIFTSDFRVYLIENGYISSYNSLMTPHNGKHLNCGLCQLEIIKKNIVKRRNK